MTPLAGGTTVLLVGVMLIRLTVTSAYQRYVRVGMGPWLLVAGVLLAVLGAAAVVRALRRGAAPEEPEHEGHGTELGNEPGDEHEHEHEHEHGDRVGWLVLVPVLALLLVAPPALGSFGVDRSRVTTAAGASAVFAPLPDGPAPRSLTLLEFDQRAVDRGGNSLRGAQVRLTGFVARQQDGSGFRLARYQIACCAADAAAAVVRLVGVPGPPARDTWLSVAGTYRGTGADGVPELAVTASRVVPAPEDPYEG